jgi:hypothetical protein
VHMRTAIKHEQAAGKVSPASRSGFRFHSIRWTVELGGTTTTRWALQGRIADPRLSFTYARILTKLHLGKSPAG